MRIISGKYKGRKIDGYTIEGTRPTMDRVKESVLGMIQTKLSNSVCLDLFTGSGSVGIELLSNGVKKCYFVDNNQKVIETLNKNIKLLNISEDYEIIKSSYEEVLKNFKNRNIKFDLIFLDPPYKLNYINPAIQLISELSLLNEDGLIICECETEEINITEYKLIKERKYGSKKIKIYEK